MNWKRMVAILAILITVPLVWGRRLGSDAPQQSLGSRGDVTTTGSLVSISGLVGSSRVTYSIIIANDDDVDNLLVATDVPTATATDIPVPAADITSLSRVLVIAPGEKLSLNQGAQIVGLRAETGTVPTRLILTKR